MIPFINRFHGHSSINFVYRNGQPVRSRWFIIKVVKNKSKKNTRAAVVISKKVLKSAVKRNRVRRQVYEYISKLMPRLNDNYDMAIIILSSEVFSAPQAEIFSGLDRLIDQLNILN